MSGDKLGGWVVSAWLTTTNGKGGEGVVENFRPGMPGIPLLLEQLRNSNDAEMCERNPPATTTTTLDWPPPTKTLEHLSPLFLSRRNDDSQKKTKTQFWKKNVSLFISTPSCLDDFSIYQLIPWASKTGCCTCWWFIFFQLVLLRSTRHEITDDRNKERRPKKNRKSGQTRKEGSWLEDPKNPIGAGEQDDQWEREQKKQDGQWASFLPSLDRASRAVDLA